MRASPKYLSCRAVLFDASGTLIVITPSFEEIFSSACAKAGANVDQAEASRILAGVQDEYRAAIVALEAGGRRLEPGRAQAVWTATFNAKVSAALPGMRAERVEEELSKTVGRWRASEDAAPTLRMIRKSGRRTGVVSNFDASLRRVLAESGLGEELDCVIASAEAGCEKPDPRIFEAALAALGVGPGETIHVGDDAFDVIGAAAAGIASVWLNPSGAEWRPPRGSTATPQAVIRRLSELPALMGLRGAVTE